MVFCFETAPNPFPFLLPNHFPFSVISGIIEIYLRSRRAASWRMNMKHYYIKLTAALAIILAAGILCFRLASPGISNIGDSKEIETLINTLYSGKVHVAPELIDTDEHTVSSYNMKNALDAPSLARQFLGKDAVKDSSTQFSASDGSFTVNGTHFTYTPALPKFSADTKSISLANATQIAGTLCDEYGIDARSGRTELSGGRDGIYVAVMKSLDGQPVFNNALVLELHTDGLRSITGVDYVTDGAAEQPRCAKSISDALTEFMNTCTDKSRETIITDVRLGYLLDSTDDNKTSAKPVWRIIVENSSVYYIDA